MIATLRWWGNGIFESNGTKGDKKNYSIRKFEIFITRKLLKNHNHIYATEEKNL